MISSQETPWPYKFPLKPKRQKRPLTKDDIILIVWMGLFVTVFAVMWAVAENLKAYNP